MSQNFLLSRYARGLSLVSVMRMTEEEAYKTFQEIRWAENGGEPVCPYCGSTTVYTFTKRRIFKCKDCRRQFSLTSRTIFASHKKPIGLMLAAIAIFINGAKGYSALQLSRDLDVEYKTAFVLAHKIREALGAANDNGAQLGGVVEIDGAYFGGYVKPVNTKADRQDRRTKEIQNEKRKVVVVMRERNGRALTGVFKSESASVPTIQRRVASDATIHADEASSWDNLYPTHAMERINHSESYSDGVACTNQAESFFSRLRRAEIGIHHHISAAYLSAYANEMAWRENHRRVSNRNQYLLTISAVSHHPVSRQWKGYWQRSA